MIANIELKSLDFDDENFSPVFNRSKKEAFIEMSDKYKKDLSRVYINLNTIVDETILAIRF